MSKRKPVYGKRVSKNNIVQLTPVDKLIVIVPGSATCTMKRLKYKGCPTLKRGTYDGEREFKDGTVLVDANRDSFIRELHTFLSENINGSTYTNFKNIAHFLKWVDENEIEVTNSDYFNEQIITLYAQHWSNKIAMGNASPRSWENTRSTLVWYLNRTGRESLSGRLPRLKFDGLSTNHHKPYCVESELKPLAKSLMRSYKILKDHLGKNTLPSTHPLFDEDDFNTVSHTQNLDSKEIARRMRRFKKLVSCDITNSTVKVAMMLTYLFTGMNATPLKRIRICDVAFSQLQGNRFILRSVKDRANGVEIDNAMGFSKHAKEFIEGWWDFVMGIAGGDKEFPLFPYKMKDGEFISYAKTSLAPQTELNELLPMVGLPKINASRLRKTKLDVLLRTTESVYLVSQSGNNSINVVSRNYTNGVDSDHEKNLSASMDATFKISKGSDIQQAVSQAKFKHADILDHYEYERLREGKSRASETRTPLGIRCQNNRNGAAELIKKSLERSGIKTNDEEAVCTDFLSCFDCAEHALVSDVDDIWLMLSFADTLQQMEQIPAINSTPEDKYEKLRLTIDDILIKFKHKSPSNYNEAEEKHRIAPHPLYSHARSLIDLQEVFS